MGIPGEYPATTLLEETDLRKHRSRQLAAAVLGVGRADVLGCTAGGVGPVPTLRARSVLRPSLVQDLADARLLANKGEINVLFTES